MSGIRSPVPAGKLDTAGARRSAVRAAGAVSLAALCILVALRGCGKATVGSARTPAPHPHRVATPRGQGQDGSLPRAAAVPGPSVTASGDGAALVTSPDESAGHAALHLAPSVELGLGPAGEIVSLAGMAPGDSATGAVRVRNEGSQRLRYTLSSSATGSRLAGQLQLTIRVGVRSCTRSEWLSSGGVVYGPGPLTGAVSTKLIGNPALGADPGDRVLAPGASEVLCFHVALPLATGNALERQRTSVRFTFAAEQARGG